MFHQGITLSDAANLVLRHLRTGQVATPDTDARMLMQIATGLTHIELITHRAEPLTQTQRVDLERLLKQRLDGWPIGRLTGLRDFWGLRFQLSPETLEPRPDSETVVEEALDWARTRRASPIRILDLGSGSGCLLIALLTEVPMASGVGVDISPGAVEVAALNATAHGVASRARFITGSWAVGLSERFDLIVSNPPYITTSEIDGLSREVREHDPLRALDGGADGLDAYRAILADLPRVMAANAAAILEIGAGQEADVTSLARKNGLDVANARRDLGGHVRALAVQLKAPT